MCQIARGYARDDEQYAAAAAACCCLLLCLVGLMTFQRTTGGIASTSIVAHILSAHFFCFCFALRIAERSFACSFFLAYCLLFNDGAVSFPLVLKLASASVQRCGGACDDASSSLSSFRKLSKQSCPPLSLSYMTSSSSYLTRR